MKTLFLITWRNLWRRRRRSALVISTVAIGICAMLFSMGFTNGLNRQMIDNTVATSLGHVAIHRKGFFDNMLLESNFAPAGRVTGALTPAAGVKAWAPRVKVQCMIQSSEASQGVVLTGVDPARERAVSRLPDYILKDGGAFLDDPGAHQVLISDLLARKLDIGVGDSAVLMMQDAKNEIAGVGFTVRGIFTSPMESFDRYMVFTGIGSLQKITGVGDAVSEIVVMTDHRDRADALKQNLARRIGDETLEILSWRDMAPGLVSAVAMYEQNMYILYVIVFVTIIFLIAATMIMAVMERFREIGVMKSIGTRPGIIFGMVMMEAVNLGIVGLVAGTVVGAGMVLILSAIGVDFGASSSLRQWGTGSTIYPFIYARDIIMSAAIVFATTVLAVIYPAIKAARIRPLEALHHV